MSTYESLAAFLPHVSNHEYDLKHRWLMHILNKNMAVEPDFVNDMNRSAHIIDIRSEKELIESNTIIPGANIYPLSIEKEDDDLQEITRDFSITSLIAIVCSNGVRSSRIANKLRTEYDFKFVYVKCNVFNTFYVFNTFNVLYNQYIHYIIINILYN